MKLCTKYQRPRPSGIRLEDFLKVFSISLCETCRPKGRAILGLRAIMKNLDRGPLGEAMYQISKAWAFCFQKIFNFFPYMGLCKTSDPRRWTIFDPRAIIEVH